MNKPEDTQDKQMPEPFPINYRSLATAILQRTMPKHWDSSLQWYSLKALSQSQEILIMTRHAIKQVLHPMSCFSENEQETAEVATFNNFSKEF